MSSVKLRVRDPEDQGARADVVLGRRVPGLSRRKAREMALEGHLRINDRPAPPSTRVQHGDALKLLLESNARPMPELDVLHTTEAFVYVAKPAGVFVHPLRPDDPPTLGDAVIATFPECAQASPDPRERGAVHRLDRPTTGVVAFARNRDAWHRARDGFSSDQIRKAYLALCAAQREPPWPPTPPTAALPGWLTFDAPRPALLDGHAEHPGIRIRAPLSTQERHTVVSPLGMPAETMVWALGWCRLTKDHTWPHRLLCGLRLQTGRRHQARVHLAWSGLPIVGDRRYGAVTEPSDALLLHAFALDLSEISSTEPPVYAPLPTAFSAALARCGLADKTVPAPRS